MHEALFGWHMHGRDHLDADPLGNVVHCDKFSNGVEKHT